MPVKSITRVSTDGANPVFSPDGTKVAFWSASSDLVPGDTNNSSDIFIAHLSTGSVERVSTNDLGVEGNGNSYRPIFSRDNNKLVFQSYASNFAPGDTNGNSDIFVKNLSTGLIQLVSTNAAGAPSDGSSSNAIFSPDGEKVAFDSYDRNLVTGDTNNARDIFLKTLASGAIERISTDAAGSQADGDSVYPCFSPDGTSGLHPVSETRN